MQAGIGESSCPPHDFPALKLNGRGRLMSSLVRCWLHSAAPQHSIGALMKLGRLLEHDEQDEHGKEGGGGGQRE